MPKNQLLLFAGIIIVKKNRGYEMNQEQYTKKSEMVDKNSADEKFKTMYHKLDSIMHIRLKIISSENIISELIVKTDRYLMSNPTLRLYNKSIDIDSASIMLYSDDSFPGNNDGSSQVGYLILLA